MPLVDHWPLFGLEVRTPRLTLRYPDDDLGLELVELAELGIHDPDTMPFSVPWTDDPTSAHLQHLWRNRADWTVDKWHLQLVAVVDGVVVGTQAMVAEQFPVLRTVTTGSWLGKAHQRQGLGTEMRAAMLHLAFSGLGARVAATSAWHDNDASLGVTRALGYEGNGWALELRRDRAERHLRFLLTRERWEVHRRADVEVVGLEACLPSFGIGADLTPS